jgi:hypothetical protein
MTGPTHDPVSTDELLAGLKAMGVPVDSDLVAALQAAEPPPETSSKPQPTKMKSNRWGIDIPPERRPAPGEPGDLLCGLIEADSPLPADPTEVLQMLGILDKDVDCKEGSAGGDKGSREETVHSADRHVGDDGSSSRSALPSLDGGELLKDPDTALQKFRAAGGTDAGLLGPVMKGESLLHLVRTGSQPAVLRATLKAYVPVLARQMCLEAGVDGVSAMMVAEQAAEARADEAYHRALAGQSLDDGDTKQADKLNKSADRFSSRMMRATEQLFRMRRPKVNVTVKSIANLNLGEQKIVNGSDDTSTAQARGPVVSNVGDQRRSR